MWPSAIMGFRRMYLPTLTGEGMRSLRSIAVLTLLVYATGLSAALASKNRDLRHRNAEFVRNARIPQAGMYVPPVSVESVDGRLIQIGDPEPATRQVLLVFDTRCEFCIASLPAWRELAASLRHDPASGVVAISTDPPDETNRYVKAHDLDFPIATVADPRIRSMYRWSGVPLIMVIEPDGLVRYARAGELRTGLPLDSVLTVLRAPMVAP